MQTNTPPHLQQRGIASYMATAEVIVSLHGWRLNNWGQSSHLPHYATEDGGCWLKQLVSITLTSQTHQEHPTRHMHPSEDSSLLLLSWAYYSSTSQNEQQPACGGDRCHGYTVWSL